MKKQQITELQNLLYNCNLGKHFSFKKDEIKGKTVALAKQENNSLYIQSDFMTYKEMKAFLFGLYHGKNNTFK